MDAYAPLGTDRAQMDLGGQMVRVASSSSSLRSRSPQPIRPKRSSRRLKDPNRLGTSSPMESSASEDNSSVISASPASTSGAFRASHQLNTQPPELAPNEEKRRRELVVEASLQRLEAASMKKSPSLHSLKKGSPKARAVPDYLRELTGSESMKRSVSSKSVRRNSAGSLVSSAGESIYEDAEEGEGGEDSFNPEEEEEEDVFSPAEDNEPSLELPSPESWSGNGGTVSSQIDQQTPQKQPLTSTPHLSPDRTPTLGPPAPQRQQSPASPSTRPTLILTRSESAALDYEKAQQEALAKRASISTAPTFRSPFGSGALLDRRASLQAQPSRRLSLNTTPTGPSSTAIPLRRYSGVPRPLTPTKYGHDTSPLASPTKDGENGLKAWHPKPLVLTPARTVDAPLTANAVGASRPSSRLSISLADRPLSPFGNGPISPNGINRRRSMGYNNGDFSLNKRDSMGSNASSSYVRPSMRTRSPSEDTTNTKGTTGGARTHGEGSPDSSVGEWSVDGHHEKGKSEEKEWELNHRRVGSLDVLEESRAQSTASWYGTEKPIEEEDESEQDGEDQVERLKEERAATAPTPAIEFSSPSPGRPQDERSPTSSESNHGPLSPPPTIPLPVLPDQEAELADAYQQIERLLPEPGQDPRKSKYDQLWDGKIPRTPLESSPSVSGDYPASNSSSPRSPADGLAAKPKFPLSPLNGTPITAASSETNSPARTASPAHNPQYTPITIKSSKSTKSVKSNRSSKTLAATVAIPSRSGSRPVDEEMSPPIPTRPRTQPLNHARSEGFSDELKEGVTRRGLGTRSNAELRSGMEALDSSTGSSHRGLALWPPKTMSTATETDGETTDHRESFDLYGDAYNGIRAVSPDAVVHRRVSQISPRMSSPLPPSPVPTLSFSHPDPTARPFPPPPGGPRKPRFEPRDPRSIAQGPDNFLEVLLTEPAPPPRAMSPTNGGPPPTSLHAAYARPESALSTQSNDQPPLIPPMPSSNNIRWSAVGSPPPASPASSKATMTPSVPEEKRRKSSFFGRFVSGGSKDKNRNSIASTTSRSSAKSLESLQTPTPPPVPDLPSQHRTTSPLPTSTPTPTNRRPISIPAHGQVRPSSMASTSSRRSNGSIHRHRRTATGASSEAHSVASYLPKHPPVSPLFGQSGYEIDVRSASPSPLSGQQSAASSRPTSQLVSNHSSPRYPERRSSLTGNDGEVKKALGTQGASPPMVNGPNVAGPLRTVNDDIEEELADWKSTSSRPASIYSVKVNRGPPKPYALPPGLGGPEPSAPVRPKRRQVDPYEMPAPGLRVASALYHAGPPSAPRRGSSIASMRSSDGGASPASTYASMQTAQSGGMLGSDAGSTRRPSAQSQVAEGAYHLPSGTARGKEMAAVVGGYALGPRGEMVRPVSSLSQKMEPREAFRLQSLER